MSAQYTQSKQTQLLGRELADLVQLTGHLLGDHGSGTGPALAPSEASRALLTSAHLRQLVTDAMVRVAVPPRKHEALIQGNPYIRAAATAKAAAAARERKLAGASSDGGGDGGAARVDEERLLPTHRVGRIVALLPKPGSAAAGPATAPPALSTSVDDWMLAVALGETTELFPLRLISDDALTEEEHQMHMQSALGSRAAAPPASLTSPPAVLSGEQAQALVGRLRDVRAALLLVTGRRGGAGGGAGGSEVATTTTTAAGMTQQALDSALERVAASQKRPRTESAEGSVVACASPGETVSGGTGTGTAAHSDSASVEAARLREVIARQAAQLQSLRTLVQTKESEVAAAHQAHRLAEQQHAVEVGQLRSKAEEEARARERGMRETAEQLQERDGRLQAAGRKLHQVAELADRYKKVYNTLVNSAMGFTPEQARATTPEEVMALLKARKALGS